VTEIDESRLDDPAGIAALDGSEMLRAVASSAAQVRSSAAAAAAADLGAVAADGRPRSVVVCGMGGSGIAGDALAAVLGAAVPLPIVMVRSWALPGWVGPADLVAGVSCSGTTAETLAAVDEARRRGCRLVGVGSGSSPLEDIVLSGRGSFVPVTPVLAPRASLWALLTPLLVLAAELRLIDLGAADQDGVPEALAAAADRLEQAALACRHDRESFVNPAKELAVALASGLPLIWGSGQVGPVAAQRLGCQLAENAKTPSVHGGLPEALHNQVVTLDAPHETGDGDDEDFFRDRVDDPAPAALQLVLLRDDDGDERSAVRADIAEQLAASRGVRTTTLRAEGAGPVERLASLVARCDYASVYLGLLRGVDPTPIAAIDELKAELGRLSG
jgi:glucose/mannose-6-phosphate isomerase